MGSGRAVHAPPGGGAVQRGGAGTSAEQARQAVLTLLSEGLSNRDIAERLFLSRKTIEHHIRSLFAKLGMADRAEAAA